MNYVQFTEAQKAQMLAACGASSMEDLLRQVPASMRLRGELDLPAGMDELSLRRHLSAMADNNSCVSDKVCFLGAGAYDHFIPAVVDHLAMKGEFLTAYTPYQAEASQGTLQAFFEFQTMVCQLTGMEVANSSLYDGATALAEAALMALAVTGKREIIVSQGVHPQYRAVLRTYLADLPARYTEIPLKNGVVDSQELESELETDTAAVLVQSPNYFGHIEAVETIGKFAHANESLIVQVFNPVALGLMKRPGEMDVDIAVAEGQPLGIPLGFGGPYLGLFAAKGQFVRKMPGRLVGQTTDIEGQRAFCLTLQTREQHIRREKATSNVCTNQGLLAMRASVHLAAMGPAGMREAAQLCFNKATYLRKELAKVGIKPRYPDRSHFNEILVRLNEPVARALGRASAAGILAGHAVGGEYPELGDCLLIAVTEKRTKGEMDRLVGVLAGTAGAADMADTVADKSESGHDAGEFVMREVGE